MNEAEQTPIAVDEDAAILPDGWDGTGDIFDESTWTDAGSAAETTADSADTAVADTPAEELPTTEPETQEADSEEGTGEETPTIEPSTEPKTPTKLRFKTKYDHEDMDVELDEADLPTVYQKSLVAERVQKKLTEANAFVDRTEQLARVMGYKNATEMLDTAGTNFHAAEVKRLVDTGWDAKDAEDFVTLRGQARRDTQGGAPQQAETAPSGESTAPAPLGDTTLNGRDFKAEVETLLSVRPALRGKPLPEAVATAAVKEGKNLLVAYLEYETAENDKRAVELQKENKVLKQNAASAARAPVKGVSGGGATDTKPTDPFMAGFDSAW